MRLGRNSALFGALLIITGLYILLGSGGFGFGYLLRLAVGAALLLLYYGKRKTWALVLGVVFIWLGAHSALRHFGVLTLNTACVLFFFIPGTIFMTLFLTKNMQGLLIPASVLLWCGLGLTLKALPFLPPRLSVLTVCLGMSLITIYLLGHERISRNYLYIGIIVGVFGLYSFFEPLSVMNIGKIGWRAVAVLCVILLIGSWMKNKNGGDERDE